MSLTPPLPLQPDAFGLPANAGPVELVQTHIGWIYLCGNFAFKLKKSVRFDFLDFTTLEKRKWACQRELELNARLCPSLYMGLVPVVKESNGRIRAATELVNQPDPPNLVDWAVWMKRLPAARMMDALLQADAVTEADVRKIAETLTDFYRKQKERGGVDTSTYLKNFVTNVNENFREARALPVYLLSPAELDFLEKRGRGFLRKYSKLIEQRAKNGLVIDAHGDLRAENICLPENQPPVLFDCIEFNDRFRICDHALDTAYLAMDLDSRGRSDLSKELLERYRSSCDPELPESLWDFYLGYRAFIKAKVAAWIASDVSVPTQKRADSAEQCRDLFGLAIRYALRREPVLMLCCGPAGSGKSTLAQHIALGLGVEHLATDMLRDEIIPRGAPTQERYSPANSERVYMLACERAAQELAQQKPVILDGTFITRERRKQALEIAKAAKCPSILIWADCPPGRIEHHFAQRKQEGALLGSEADLAVSVAHQQQFQAPAPDEGFTARVKIDTSGSKEKSQTEAWLKTLDALTHIL